MSRGGRSFSKCMQPRSVCMRLPGSLCNVSDLDDFEPLDTLTISQHLDESSTPWRFLNPLVWCQVINLIFLHRIGLFGPYCRVVGKDAIPVADVPGDNGIHVSTYIGICMCMHMCLFIFVCLYQWVCACMWMTVCTCVAVSTCTAWVCMCACMCIYVVWHAAGKSSACDLLFGTRPPRRHV